MFQKNDIDTATDYPKNISQFKNVSIALERLCKLFGVIQMGKKTVDLFFPKTVVPAKL